MFKLRLAQSKKKDHQQGRTGYPYQRREFAQAIQQWECIMPDYNVLLSKPSLPPGGIRSCI